MDSALLFAFPLLLAAWAAILMNWRWGVYGLVIFTPFTGPIVAAMFPSPLGALMRDIVVVVPLYIAFFLLGRNARFGRIPSMLYAVYGLLALMVLFAAANPGVPNLMVAGIGTKVWLFYIPMLIIGASFIRGEADLRNFLRALVASAWIPWGLGIIMYLGATFYDYVDTITFFYGEYARHATQQFSAFYSYGAVLYRIPGSFQFNSQYGVFCFFMLFPMLMLLEIERERRWRSFVWASMVVGLVAGFTSGARGNFVFMPLIFVMVQFFKFRASGVIQSVIGVGGGLIMALSIAGIDGSKIYGEAADLTAHYGKDIAVTGLLDGLDRGGMFGRGVGANTGAARHGQDAATAALMEQKGLLIENYYGKAMVELGAVGFFIVLGCSLLLFLFCLQVQTNLKLQPLKGVAACGTAMVGFITLTSFKGWALDTDPLNYYFYLTLGMVFALPYIERQWLAAVQRSAASVPIAPPPEDEPRRSEPAPGPAPRPVRPAAVPFASRALIGRPAPNRRGPEAFARPGPSAAAPDDTFDLGPRLRRPPREE
jgi:hypothetical protein